MNHSSDTPAPIRGVVVETLSPAHSDARRDLFAIFNGNFTARQVKLAEVKGNAIVLGCHWHPYNEMFFILAGEAHFVLCQLEGTNEMRVTLKEGMTIIIPARTPHKVTASGGTKILGFTERVYTSPDECDVPFSF